jgi:hypothetical protein
LTSSANVGHKEQNFAMGHEGKSKIRQDVSFFCELKHEKISCLEHLHRRLQNIFQNAADMLFGFGAEK